MRWAIQQALRKIHVVLKEIIKEVLEENFGIPKQIHEILKGIFEIPEKIYGNPKGDGRDHSPFHKGTMKSFRK